LKFPIIINCVFCVLIIINKYKAIVNNKRNYKKIIKIKITIKKDIDLVLSNNNEFCLINFIVQQRVTFFSLRSATVHIVKDFFRAKHDTIGKICVARQDF